MWRMLIESFHPLKSRWRPGRSLRLPAREGSALGTIWMSGRRQSRGSDFMGRGFLQISRKQTGRTLLLLMFALLPTAQAMAQGASAGDASLRRQVETVLGRDLDDAYAANGQRAKLQLQGLDLNADGQQDAIVLVDHPFYCGSRGCAVHVFVREGSTLRRVGDILASEVKPALTTTSGWRDLLVNGRRWHMAQGQYRPAPP